MIGCVYAIIKAFVIIPPLAHPGCIHSMSCVIPMKAPKVTVETWNVYQLTIALIIDNQSKINSNVLQLIDSLSHK